MDKEDSMLIKVNAIEKSIDFWNEQFDEWHMKLLNSTSEEEVEKCQENLNQCWKRMEMEKDTACSLEKEISEIISKNY